jgi:hypothetical protein
MPITMMKGIHSFTYDHIQALKNYRPVLIVGAFAPAAVT